MTESKRERETSEYLGVIAIVAMVDDWRGWGYGSCTIVPNSGKAWFEQ